MADIHPRLRAVWDLSVAEVREYCGRHEYDGTIQDLSPDGVRAGLRELAAARPGEPAEPAEALADDHDEAHLVVFERAAQVSLGELELHRSNPYFHIANMDLACYDREYAPRQERTRARAAHLAAWPEAADAAVRSLDAVTAPVGKALAGASRGLAAGIGADAGPPDRPARRELRAGRSRPAGPAGGARTGPPAPGRRRCPDGRAGMDQARDRLHHQRRPGAVQRRRVPGAAGPRVAALGDGHDVDGRARRAGGPVAVLHHPARPGLAGARGRGVARGVQRHDAARNHRARGRARALLARPGDPAGCDRRQAHAALRRIRRGLGALRRGTVRGGGLLRRRPAVRDRRLAGGAGPRHQARLRDRHSHGRDERARGRQAVRVRHPPVRAGSARGGEPGDLRPDLRPLHLGQAGDNGTARAGAGGLGTGLLAAAVPHRAARSRLSPARPARHRGAAGLRPDPPVGCSAMSDLDDLDALSSRELHDLAVRRARHHLDVAFLWDLLRALPAGEAIAGHPDHAGADALHLSALIGDTIDADETDVADALRPLYLDYLRKHRKDLADLEHDAPHPREP